MEACLWIWYNEHRIGSKEHWLFSLVNKQYICIVINLGKVGTHKGKTLIFPLPRDRPHLTYVFSFSVRKYTHIQTFESFCTCSFWFCEIQWCPGLLSWCLHHCPFLVSPCLYFTYPVFPPYQIKKRSIPYTCLYCSVLSLLLEQACFRAVTSNVEEKEGHVY